MRFLRILSIPACLAIAITTLASTCQAQGTSGSPDSQERALQAFGSELRRLTASGQFSGVALVAKDGKPIFESAYGLADIEKKTPNAVNTLFNLGSNDKVFTSVAILQLAEAGKLKVSDPIGKYLTDYPNKEMAKSTIEELLTHRGAAGDFFVPQYLDHRNEVRALADFVKLFGTRGPDGVPGGRPVYSNYGYILLGLIIERVSGEDYYTYVADHIFKPAGMTSTDFPLASDRKPGIAIGYTVGDDKTLRSNDDTLPYRGTSAGGGYSTVGDLLRFYNALWAGKLLNAHSVRLLIEGEASKPGGPVFPYGMGGLRTNGARYYAHAGGAPGVSAEMESSPQTGYTIIVLANRDPMIATDLGKFIRERLPVK